MFYPFLHIPRCMLYHLRVTNHLSYSDWNFKNVSVIIRLNFKKEEKNGNVCEEKR